MLNRAILMGRLCADPEYRTTRDGVCVVSFTLAVGRDYTKPGEERPTDFIDIVAWRHTAEFVKRHFSKGMQMAVSGSLQTRIWEDKQGNKRKSVEVVAQDVYFADRKERPTIDVESPPNAPDTDFQELEADGLPF